MIIILEGQVSNSVEYKSINHVNKPWIENKITQQIRVNICGILYQQYQLTNEQILFVTAYIALFINLKYQFFVSKTQLYVWKTLYTLRTDCSRDCMQTDNSIPVAAFAYMVQL